MKKLLSLGLTVVCLATLSGCENMTRAIRGNDYVDAKTAASSSAAQASASASSSKAYQKEVKKALQADASAFPQLSTEVAQNEAEVIMHTSKGDITIKLFPKYAPLAVENFLTHAKKGYYDGLLFHRVISDFMISLVTLKETAQEENLSGKAKTRKSILVMVLLTKSHLISITSEELLLWQTLVLIPMVANFSSTKIQLTNLVSSQATAIQKQSLMLILKVVTQA